jgi:hypothetical protein
MRNFCKKWLSVTLVLAFGAMLAACSSPQMAPTASAAAPFAVAASTKAGKLEISRSGSGLMVRLVNPKDGAASSFSAYGKDKADCNNGAHPCYIFSAINGTAPMPVSGACPVIDQGGTPTAFCAAHGVSSVTIDAATGGTIGHDASGPSELGKNCFPSSVTYEVGAKDVYSVLAWDGCKETIRCAGKNVGTVDADSKDAIKGPCYFVQRH